MLGYKSVINYYKGNTLYFMVKIITLKLLIEYVKIKYLQIYIRKAVAHIDKGSDVTPCVPGKSSLRYNTMHIINQEHVIPSFNE